MLLFTSPMLRLLLPLLLAATSSHADDLKKCYKQDGTYDPEMKPCDPSAQASTCCRPTDFCLSNGLCLGGGGNNGFSQQGCTLPKWGFPCQAYCSPSIASYQDGFQYLSQCSGFDANATNPFCCGGDYGCCKDPANLIKGLAKFTTMSRAGAVETASGSSPVSTTTVVVTVTSTAKPTPGGDPYQVVAVGAGVGVSLGVALLGVVGLLGWQIRKNRKQYSVVSTPAPSYTYSGRPKHTDDAPIELSSPPTELPATPHRP